MREIDALCNVNYAPGPEIKSYARVFSFMRVREFRRGDKRGGEGGGKRSAEPRRDSSRVIKRRLYSGTSFPEDRSSAEDRRRTGTHSWLAVLYVEIIVRIANKVSFSRVARSTQAFFLLECERALPRRFTISNYNDYADLLRDQLFVPLSLAPFFEGNAEKKESSSRINRPI